MSDRENPAINQLWHLAEVLSMRDAAALVAGYEPATIKRCRKDTGFDRDYPGYAPAFTAISEAATAGTLRVEIRYSAREYGSMDALADRELGEALHETRVGSTAEADEHVSPDRSCFYKPFPDWELSTVRRKDLVDWLISRGFTKGFFFPEQPKVAGYVDAGHPRYAPKLAAALGAWNAMEDASLLTRKTPKQALSRWIREHAAEFSLTSEDGKLNESGIEECAKVANWQDKGGAPRATSD